MTQDGAHTVAAARGSPLPVHLFVFFIFNMSFICLLVTLPCRSNPIYSHQDLILIGFQAKMDITSTFSWTHNIPPEIARPSGAPGIVIGQGNDDLFGDDRIQCRLDRRLCNQVCSSERNYKTLQRPKVESTTEMDKRD